MASALLSRQAQAALASTSGRPAAPALVPARLSRASLPARAPGCRAPLRSDVDAQRRCHIVHAKKEGRKADPNAPGAGEPEETSPFIEPLLRGLVLGVGAGALCELAHVAFKVGNATDGGSHLPSVAQLYEQFAPLFVWDHAVAISFWILFYTIEAVAILAILRDYPDGKQASSVIRTTPTLPKLLMPLKLSSVKRALHTLLSGRAPQAARQGAAAMAYRDGGRGAAPLLPGARAGVGAGTSLLERPAPTPKPLPPKDADQPERMASAEMRRAAGLLPGQLHPASPLVSPREALSEKRGKELHDRRAYLQNFWYAAALSDKVTSKPLRVDVLSRTVTIWRGEDGKVHCLDNVCPHRGAPLSGGWTKTKGGKSCVVCPYHGWAFNGEGALEDVPSQSPDLAFPRRPLVDSYPVEERGGFVWLFFGAKGLPAAERPPLPIVPELEDPNWRPVYGEMEFESPHWSVFENAMDFAHIHYVHNSSFGNQENPVIEDMAVTRDTWSVAAEFSIHNKPVNALWNWAKTNSVPVQAKAFLPMTSAVKITLGGGVQMITYVNTVPIDEHRSINRIALIRNFATSPLFDGYTRKEMYKILSEDKHIIEALKPEQLLNELSLEADKPQIAFRKLRQEWIDMGYGVQPEATSRHNGSLRTDM